ncbi:hypothetical protein MPSEU_000468700 [Mayamaea pseudoterrestris]|nr:hypothetical protein MPSEU_000468700 [Mayamaea pseudoterrestris]
MKRVRSSGNLSNEPSNGQDCSPTRTSVSVRQQHTLRFIEFFSGVGGWTEALQVAIKTISGARNVDINVRCCAALDHSDLCTSVYNHNHGSFVSSTQAQEQFRIEQLTSHQLNEWKADIWLMSPPCQPHTRQHSNQANDLQDARSASFLRLVYLLTCGEVDDDAIPSVICLENVVGFEKSNSFGQFLNALACRNYQLAQFLIQPSQVGFPNDRPRFYCVAIRTSSVKGMTINDENPLNHYFHHVGEKFTRESSPPVVSVAMPELQIHAADAITEETIRRISDFLDPSLTATMATDLSVPANLFKNSAAWCFDIVSPEARRSACFTSGYGRFIRGTGSILYQPLMTDDSEQSQVFAAETLVLQDPNERKFQADWLKESKLDTRQLRYFSGTEMARLLGFSNSFSFPSHVTLKQQWKLMGNSLNVCVAAKLIELGLLAIKFR